MVFEVNKNLYWYVHNFLLKTEVTGKTAIQLFNELSVPENISVSDEESEKILQLFGSENLKQIQEVLRLDQEEIEALKRKRLF